jgi:hypothetical protein
VARLRSCRPQAVLHPGFATVTQLSECSNTLSRSQKASIMPTQAAAAPGRLAPGALRHMVSGKDKLQLTKDANGVPKKGARHREPQEKQACTAELVRLCILAHRRPHPSVTTAACGAC